MAQAIDILMIEPALETLESGKVRGIRNPGQRIPVTECDIVAAVSRAC